MSSLPDSGSGFLDNYLPHLLTLAAVAASRAFDRELRERRVSVLDWRVLAVLLERPGEKVTDLAKRCLLQQPTMTKLLGRMERDHLVRRTPDERDHRVVHVTLTGAGAALAAALVAAAQRHEATLLTQNPQAGAIKGELRSIVEKCGQPES